MKTGIDISYHQGDINFKKVKNENVDFIILRAGYGKTTDSKFHEYVKEIRDVDIPILGVYHFIYALNEHEALINAKKCVQEVEKAGLGKDVYIFCDYEYDTVRYANDKNVKLTSEDCNNFTKIFCEYVEAKGYKTGIYTNIDYYKHVYDKDLLAKYPVWLADYNGEPNYPCLIHQTSSEGKVSGIFGNVDMNTYYGTEPIIKEETKTEPTKSVDEIAKEVILGKWGVGAARKEALTKAGYSYKEVQTRVNELMDSPKKEVTATQKAQKFADSYTGTYRTTTAVYMRNGAGTNNRSLCVLPANTKVNCYGYYTVKNGYTWLYIQATLDGVLYTGFTHNKYLTK